MPQASWLASFMQQRINGLCVPDLIDAKARRTEGRGLVPRIRYNVSKKEADQTVCTFSDASFNISSSQIYGQGGIKPVWCLAPTGGVELSFTQFIGPVESIEV